MRRIVAIVAIAVLAASCSPSKRQATASPTRIGQPSDGASLTPGPGGASGAPTTASGKAPPAPAPSASGGYPRTGPGPNNTLPLKVTLNRTCARTGDEMVAEAVTAANTQITFAAAYADNTQVPDFHYIPKDANVDGRATWRWVIRPDVPPGDAILQVVAAGNGKGANYNIRFEVAKAC